jgi:D-glycero-D-manno-heptose 1,7-bisphosphate phosphatase
LSNQGTNYHDWNVLSGRRSRLKRARDDGHTLAIITNQGAVAFGRITEEDFHIKIRAVLAALRLPDDTPIAMCFAHPDAPPDTPPAYRDPEQVARRKPSGTMIRELVVAHPQAAAQGVLYVGDMAEDYAMARDADVQFQWAWDFFEESVKSRWQKENSGLAVFNQDVLTITLNPGTLSEHEFDLKECTDSATLLDSILDVSSKVWCTPQMLFDLLLCIEEASTKMHGLPTRKLFCPLGLNRNVTWRE